MVKDEVGRVIDGDEVSAALKLVAGNLRRASDYFYAFTVVAVLR